MHACGRRVEGRTLGAAAMGAWTRYPALIKRTDHAASGWCGPLLCCPASCLHAGQRADDASWDCFDLNVVEALCTEVATSSSSRLLGFVATKASATVVEHLLPPGLLL